VGLSSWLSDEIEKMQSVEVAISGYEYKVVIGPGVVKQLLDQDLPVCNAHRLAVIADATVARLHQDSLSAVLPTVLIGSRLSRVKPTNRSIPCGPYSMAWPKLSLIGTIWC
jgi:3-dehydroquinate synthetase